MHDLQMRGLVSLCNIVCPLTTMLIQDIVQIQHVRLVQTMSFFWVRGGGREEKKREEERWKKKEKKRKSQSRQRE